MSKSVTLGYEVVKDLIDTKQDVIRTEIRTILLKWGAENAEDFIEKVRIGEIKEGEHDAILLTNFIDELKTLESILG